MLIFTDRQAPVTVAVPIMRDKTILIVTVTCHTSTEEVDQKTILVGLGVQVNLLSVNVAANLLVKIVTLSLEGQCTAITLGVILVLDTLGCQAFTVHGQHIPLPVVAAPLTVDLHTLPRDLVWDQTSQQTLEHPLMSERGAFLIAS